MVHSACVPRLTMADSGIVQPALVVRVTHWIIAPPLLSLSYLDRRSNSSGASAPLSGEPSARCIPTRSWIILKRACVGGEVKCE
jgi:hypothetical protein